MANDIAGLSAALSQQLRDVDHVAWNSVEKDDLIRWSVANLYPRYARPLDPSLAAQEVTLVADTYFYALPTGMIEVTRLDLLDPDDNEEGTLDGQAWRQDGDPVAGGLKLFVSPRIVDNLGGTVRVHGFARFDTTTNLIPDDYVPLVLANARAEAYRRMGGDRARFENWKARDQRQNVSVNELYSLITEAESEAMRVDRSTPNTWRRPVPGRLG